MSKIINQSKLTSKFTLPDRTIVEAESRSNISQTEYMTDSFLKRRETAKNYGVAHEEILQTLTLQNNSDHTISNIRIQDDVPKGLSFKNNTLKIDDVAFPDFNPSNFTLPNALKSSDSSKITYVISIDENSSLNKAKMCSHVTYLINNEEFTEKSNGVEIEIRHNKPKITYYNKNYCLRKQNSCCHHYFCRLCYIFWIIKL